MHTFRAESGTAISYARQGRGPALVLIHGGFSDHESNWQFVAPLLRDRFSLYAIARRGRGQTAATTGHTVEDEAMDAVALIREIDEPVFLLGHSYGAHVALAAARMCPRRVGKLVLYEPPWPSLLRAAVHAPLEMLAGNADWDGFAAAFFRDVLRIPAEEVNALRTSEHWPPILADASATLGDLRALSRYQCSVERFAGLRMPVQLQVGTASPRHLYLTDALAAVLPGAHIATFAGQAHEAMTNAPALYAPTVAGFLLDDTTESPPPAVVPATASTLPC